MVINEIHTLGVANEASNTFIAEKMHVPANRFAQPPENGPLYIGKDPIALARIGGPNVPLIRGPEDMVSGRG